ncbi:PREDICTED: uncharacterized protein LOC106820093, partial [Priapulus caudatus]|uniref:Uncharacterized protein LOC106820093 n=1 Tax=Priapulus caudatus TaxID=37621 RepID=A0ABM1F6R7_PRICU
MVPTQGVLNNTGIPPICTMTITDLDGNRVTTTSIGQPLLLKLFVTPRELYGGFARNCYARTANEDWKYELIDEKGCAHDSTLFKNFNESPEGLVAQFNAFKFPGNSYLKFECDVRVCVGQCEP